MFGVGRDLCGSFSPTLLPKQGHLQQAAQEMDAATLVRAVGSWLWYGWEKLCVDVKGVTKLHSGSPLGLAKSSLDLAILSPVVLIITK